MIQSLPPSGELSEVEEEEDNSIAKAVTVKFARRENERMKKAREKSFNYLNAKSQEEPWYQTQFCDMFSKESTVSINMCTYNDGRIEGAWLAQG